MRALIITQTVDTKNPVLGFFHGWIIEFAQTCDRVDVICLSEGAHELPANVYIHSLRKESGATRIEILLLFFKYIIRLSDSYDFVFVHMNQIYVLLGGLYWRLKNKQIGLWYAHKHVSTSLRLAEKIAHLIFTPSAESFRISSKKIIVTGHGIPTKIFVPNKNEANPHIISSISRITPIKDIETIIEAAGFLRNKNISYSILLFGSPITKIDHQYQKSIKQKITDLHLNSSVRFMGSVPNNAIVTQIQNSSIILNTSLTGSMDKSVLEAMSCGVPVITCNESFADILPKSLQFEQKNAKDLAEKLTLIIQLDPSVRAELSNKLRKIILENHDLSELIKKIIHAYSFSNKTT